MGVDVDALHYTDLESNTWYWYTHYTEGDTFHPAFVRDDGKVFIDDKLFDKEKLKELDFYEAVMPDLEEELPIRDLPRVIILDSEGEKLVDTVVKSIDVSLSDSNIVDIEFFDKENFNNAKTIIYRQWKFTVLQIKQDGYSLRAMCTL